MGTEGGWPVVAAGTEKGCWEKSLRHSLSFGRQRQPRTPLVSILGGWVVAVPLAESENKGIRRTGWRKSLGQVERPEDCWVYGRTGVEQSVFVFECFFQ